MKGNCRYCGESVNTYEGMAVHFLKNPSNHPVGAREWAKLYLKRIGKKELIPEEAKGND
jgi:hypothetical protein